MEKTLSYSQLLSAPAADIHRIICRSQLQYFQSYSKKIESLYPGLKISRDFYTKMNQAKVPGTSRLSALEEGKIALEHRYGGSSIHSCWLIEPAGEQTRLTYSETNIFEDALKERNFRLVSLFYRFAFRKQTRKRMDWIAGECEALG